MDLSEMTTEELWAEFRRRSSRTFSTVGDERSQYASVRQWSDTLAPIMQEIVRRESENQSTEDHHATQSF